MKISLICMKMYLQAELIFIWMVSHEDSFWNRGKRKLRNGLFEAVLKNSEAHEWRHNTDKLRQTKWNGERFEVIYQTRKTAFDHISKHREESWKYDVQRSIFDKLHFWWGVWKCGQTLFWVFDISFQSKLKLRRKRRNKIVKIYAN